MAMTVIVTSNVPDRFRGFLASCMCEVAPGVYTAPRMGAGVRERVWSVLESWWAAYPESTVLMTWPDRTISGGQNLRTLGIPATELREHHGVFLARRDLGAEHEGPPQAMNQGAGTLEDEERGPGGTGSEKTKHGAAADEGVPEARTATSQATASGGPSPADGLTKRREGA